MQNGDKDEDMGQDVTENDDDSPETEHNVPPVKEQYVPPLREQTIQPVEERSVPNRGSQYSEAGERSVPNRGSQYSEQVNIGCDRDSARTQNYRPPIINLGPTNNAHTVQSGATVVSPTLPPQPLMTLSPAASKFDSIKAWSVNKIVCTRQILSERLGRGTKTVDADLDIQIEDLRDTQRKYEEMHRQARTLTTNFGTVVTSQRALADTFRELAQKIPELNVQFEINADSHKLFCKKGEILLNDLNFFTSSISTLCGKTIEDTLLTVKQYESARIEYDAYRTDLEADLRNPAKAEEAQRQFDIRKEKFEGLREDVAMKIKLLNGNKVKVMHKQLLLLHNAVTAYFTDNQSALQDSQQRFKDIKPRTDDVEITGDDI